MVIVTPKKIIEIYDSLGNEFPSPYGEVVIVTITDRNTLYITMKFPSPYGEVVIVTQQLGMRE